MNKVTLHPISAANWECVADLAVAAGQEEFVAPNTFSLLQAAYGIQHESALKLVPRAICADDEIVGFALYSMTPSEGRCAVERLMIDAKHQRKGFGRAAMHALLNLFRTEPGVEEVWISYAPENDAARRLYAQLGFEEIGMDKNGEMQACLVLAR